VLPTSEMLGMPLSYLGSSHSRFRPFTQNVKKKWKARDQKVEEILFRSAVLRGSLLCGFDSSPDQELANGRVRDTQEVAGPVGFEPA
jgi:hypothetical protein